MTKPAILVGLLGTGIQAAATPQLHMREGERLGLRYLYRLIDFTTLGLGPESLPEILTAAERMGFNGLAVTHPFKQAVMPFLTELSDEARTLDGVNTIVLEGGKRVGHNTDWLGFSAAFRRNLSDARRRRVVQLGAGGAGGAVAYAGLRLGFETLTIFDLDETKARKVVEQLAAHFGAGRAEVGHDLREAVSAADGVVNATPIGMAAHPGIPLPVDLLRPDLWVSDLIYTPRETELVRQARALGAPAANGGAMVALQAAEQIRLFTGLAADDDRMLAHFDEL